MSCHSAVIGYLVFALGCASKTPAPADVQSGPADATPEDVAQDAATQPEAEVVAAPAAPDPVPVVERPRPAPRLPARFRPLFHQLAKAVYQWSYDLPEGAPGGGRKGKARIVCQPTERRVYATGVFAKLACDLEDPEGDGPRPRTLDGGWCADARGLTPCEEPGDDARFAIVTREPWLATEPQVASAEGFTVTAAGKRWCREDRSGERLRRRCFEADRGLVSDSLDAPGAHESYRLVSMPALPEAGELLFAGSVGDTTLEVVRLGELGLEPRERLELPGPLVDVAFLAPDAVVVMYARARGAAIALVRGDQVEVLPAIDEALFAMPRPAGEEVYEALGDAPLQLVKAGGGEAWVSQCAWSADDGDEDIGRPATCKARRWVRILPRAVPPLTRADDPYPAAPGLSAPRGYELVEKRVPSYSEYEDAPVDKVVLSCRGPRGRSQFPSKEDMDSAWPPTVSRWLWLATTTDPPVYAVTLETGGGNDGWHAFAACSTAQLGLSALGAITLGPRGLWRFDGGGPIMRGREALSDPWDGKVRFAP